MTQNAHVLPTVRPTVPGIKFGDVSGFRGQEDWGRWAVGKVSTLNIQASRDTWAEMQLQLDLPYPQQRLTLGLNGQELTNLVTANNPQQFTVSLPIHLKAGHNVLKLQTNKSNLDPRLQPFAPQDSSDISVSLKQLEFAPLQTFSESQPGQVYGAVHVPYPATYQSVPGRQVDLFLELNQAKALDYRLLSTADGQAFQVKLGDTLVREVVAPRRGTLVSGQLPLTPGDGLQHLTITATAPADKQADDSVRIFEKANGPATFYVQGLQLTSPPAWQGWETPLAAGAALLVLAALFWLLFDRKPRIARRT